MRKRFVYLIMLALFVCAMILPANAAQGTVLETETIQTDDGAVEVNRTVTVCSSIARSNTKSAHVVEEYKYNGKVVGEVTLSATFGYDGKTAWVISASGSHTTYDGWTYSNEKITKSGGTATLTATLAHSHNGNISVRTPLTCSPTGQIS